MSQEKERRRMKNCLLVKILFFCMTGILSSSEIYSVDYKLYRLKYKKNAIYKISIWDPKYELPTATINPSITDDDFAKLVIQAKELHRKNYKYSLDLIYILDHKQNSYVTGVKINRNEESLFYPYIYKYDRLTFIKKVIVAEEKKVGAK
jgi:hypothetical protein